MFNGEDVVVKKFVKLLVGVIDAQLLETVGGKVLKSKDVKDPDELSHILARICALVDVVHQPRKRPDK